MKEELLAAYRAALAMLANCIVLCPDELWIAVNYSNPFWRIVYHTLFYTDLYLSEGPEHFNPWPGHLPGYNALGVITPDGQKVVITIIYTREQLQTYLKAIESGIPERIDTSTLTSPCGFYWIKKSNTGLHLYNIRHIQHHTGQLVERLHGHGISGIAWKG